MNTKREITERTTSEPGISEPQQFHLFVEHPAAVTDPIPLPRGISYLTPEDAHPLKPLDHTAAASPRGVRVEPVTNPHGHLRLLLTSSRAFRPRVNGTIAPRLAVLKERDFVQFLSGFAVHVSVLNRPRIGPPPGELVGHECPVCRVQFTADTKCFLCVCGAGFHMEDSVEGLQCVQMRTECTCGRQIVLTEGFTYQPDLGHEEKPATRHD